MGQTRTLGNIFQLTVSESTIFFGIGDSAEVSTYALEQGSLGSLSFESPSIKPSRANYEAAADELLSMLGSAGERNEQKALLLKAPMPETVPRYRALLTDPNGTLWAILSPLGSGTTDLLVVDSKLGELGRILIPLEMRVFEIGSDYILGSYEDGHQMPHLAMYQVTIDRQASN